MRVEQPLWPPRPTTTAPHPQPLLLLSLLSTDFLGHTSSNSSSPFLSMSFEGAEAEAEAEAEPLPLLLCVGVCIHSSPRTYYNNRRGTGMTSEVLKLYNELFWHKKKKLSDASCYNKFLGVKCIAVVVEMLVKSSSYNLHP